jgi:hypothetical protein
MPRYAFVMTFLGAAFAFACSENGTGGAGGAGGTGGAGGSGTGGVAGTTSGAGGDSMTGGGAGTSTGGTGGTSAGGASGAAGAGTTTAGGSSGTGGAGTGGAGTGGSSGTGGAGTGGAGKDAGGGAGGAGTGGSSGAAGASGASGSAGAGGTADGGGSTTMSFFVTSKGGDNGGNFGGLDGADAFCKTLATAVSAEIGQKQWRAYLSTSTVNARDRIGPGPWRNQAGVIIANSIPNLHDQLSDAAGLNTTWPVGSTAIALDERGMPLANDVHDVLTGSDTEGRVVAGATCEDWTSASMTATGQVGHTNRMGGGRPPSWNSTHTVGCAPSAVNRTPGTVTSGGGRGSIYCFALP